jgi:hypothetical protein
MVSKDDGSAPPKIEKKLGPKIPDGADKPTPTVKMSKGPLLDPAARDSGAFRKKLVSSRLSDGSERLKLSAFRKIVLPEVLVIVPSTSTVLPGLPETLDRVNVMPSARSVGDKTKCSAITAQIVMLILVLIYVPLNCHHTVSLDGSKCSYGKLTRKLAPQVPLVLPPPGRVAV